MRKSERFKKESLDLLLQCWITFASCTKIGVTNFYSSKDHPLLRRIEWFLAKYKKVLSDGSVK